MTALNGMNTNQLQAVKWDRGSLLVLAGPGSGKTAVLTRRVARLISEYADARFRVLGLTFTTKAADEMRERVEHLLGSKTGRARMATFHSFCAEVLRQHGSHLGLRPDFEILAREEDRVRVLDEAIRKTDSPELPAVRGAGVVRMIDHLFRDGFDGEETSPLPFSGTPKEWMRTVYNNYIDTLVAGNHLDYGALLVCCLRLFRERPRIARHYRIVYRYVCVDEYQDTNRCQDLILRSLCPVDGTNLFVVADDDQIIYQWNGASPARLEDLRRDYQMQVVQLPQSYRCPAAVIELANNLIRYNLDRSSSKAALTAAGSASCSDPVRIHRFRDQSQEVAWVAADIRERDRPVDSVVLARSTKLLESVAGALRSAGLVAYLRRSRHDLESAPLRFVRAALRLAIGPREIDQLRVMCKAFFDLTGIDVRVERTEAEGDAHGGSLLRGFLEVAAADPKATRASVLVNALRDQLVDRLQYLEFADDVIAWYRDDGRHHVADGFEDDAEEEFAIWKELRQKVARDVGKEPPLSRFMQEIDLRPKIASPGRNAVQCLTIHAAKGREFRHVYLIGLVEDQLPSYHATKTGASPRVLEEERRNCFVAITRTQATLTLTYSDSYFGWRKMPSRFISEMGLNLSKEAL